MRFGAVAGGAGARVVSSGDACLLRVLAAAPLGEGGGWPTSGSVPRSRRDAC